MINMTCNDEQGSEAWSPEEVKDAVSGLLNLLSQSKSNCSNGCDKEAVYSPQADLASCKWDRGVSSNRKKEISNNVGASKKNQSSSSLNSSPQDKNRVLSNVIRSAATLYRDLILPSSGDGDNLGSSEIQPHPSSIWRQSFDNSTPCQKPPVQVSPANFLSGTFPVIDSRVSNEVSCTPVGRQGGIDVNVFNEKNGTSKERPFQLSDALSNKKSPDIFLEEQADKSYSTVSNEPSSSSDTEDSTSVKNLKAHRIAGNVRTAMKRRKIMSKEEEITFKRERNRLHAQKSREKKRNEAAEMKSEVEALKNENLALRMLIIQEIGQERAEAAFKKLA